jgi:hypothetical protein
MKIITSKLSGLALGLLIGCNAFATDIYDTFPTANGSFLQVTNGQQVGNQVTLNNSHITMSEFSFEYLTVGTYSGGGGVDLKLYSGAPTGSAIYDSGVFSPLVKATNGLNVNYFAGIDFSSNFLLPSSFTFILTFSSLGSSDVLELLLANPPSGQPGSTTPNYYYNYDGGPGLTLSSLPGGISADIGVDITGTIKAPDASLTGGLLGLGLLGIFVLRRKFAFARTI